MGGPELLLSLGKLAHLLRFKRREQTQEAGGRSARNQLTADGTEPWTVPRSPDPWAAPARSSARLRAHPASIPGGMLRGHTEAQLREPRRPESLRPSPAPLCVQPCLWEAPVALLPWALSGRAAAEPREQQ